MFCPSYRIYLLEMTPFDISLCSPVVSGYKAVIIQLFIEEVCLEIQSNSHVIESVLRWLEQGECVWLSSIVKTWGSSPTPAGTLMAFCIKDGIVGSLSGGCIEEDLLEKMKAGTLLSSQGAASYPLQVVYGGSEEEQKRFVLPCGGQLHITVEYLKPCAETNEHFFILNQKLSKRELVGRRVNVATGEYSIIEKNLKRGIRETAANLHVEIEHVMGPNYQMLLIGASEVARCVAELAKPLDFNIAVWDHREEFIRNWNVENVPVHSGSPEKLIQSNYSDVNNAIIALAHDPRVDDFALVDALATNAFYVGAIGSKRTCDNRNTRLLGYIDDIDSLEKLHSPVGLSIGSKTPYEIAISILAQVIKERRKLEKGQS